MILVCDRDLLFTAAFANTGYSLASQFPIDNHDGSERRKRGILREVFRDEGIQVFGLRLRKSGTHEPEGSKKERRM